MGKVSAKDGIIVVGGYSLSPQAYAYDISATVQPVEVTGFTDGWKNYVPGQYTGEMRLGMYWDNDANKSVTALKGLDAKCVTVIPDGFTLGNPAISIEAEQVNFNPGGGPNDPLRVGQVRFVTKGADGGPILGHALAHATVTNTATSAAFQWAALATTAECAGFLHIWTACAADTYAVKIRHCATQGGTYADLISFTLNGSALGSQRVAVASGTIQPWLQVVATRTGAAGNPFGYTVAFGAW